jgi:Zn finger protein HypA/HybF involved in hydrogenase expression
MSKKRKFKIEAEIVNGKCPTCNQFTMLVGIDLAFFRCMTCGSDLEQHVNGKISYLPAIIAPEGTKPFVKEWQEDDG